MKAPIMMGGPPEMEEGLLRWTVAQKGGRNMSTLKTRLKRLEKAFVATGCPGCAIGQSLRTWNISCRTAKRSPYRRSRRPSVVDVKAQRNPPRVSTA